MMGKLTEVTVILLCCLAVQTYVLTRLTMDVVSMKKKKIGEGRRGVRERKGEDKKKEKEGKIL